jgi:hypothetical protein
MKPLTAWRAFRHRLKGMELQQSHTAICLHWPQGHCGVIRTDLTFMLQGIHTGETLHQLVDTLLEEHSCPPADDPQDVFTEVTLFWHLPDGTWETEEYLSHLCA